MPQVAVYVKWKLPDNIALQWPAIATENLMIIIATEIAFMFSSQETLLCVDGLEVNLFNGILVNS